MIEIQYNVATRVAVRLFATSGLVPMAGVASGSVTATVVKADGTTAALTVTGANWTEVTTGAFANAGVYNLLLPASATDQLGILRYAVAVSGAETYVGSVYVGRTDIPYVSFTSSGSTVGPIVTQVSAPNRTAVNITFSSAVRMDTSATGALNLANYAVTGLAIYGVTSLADNKVSITTALQTPGVTYNVYVYNVQDLSGNVIFGT